MNTDDPIGRFLCVARERPDYPAVDLDGEIVTYAGLEDRARRLAAWFASVEAPRVLIALPQGPDAYAAMIGALMSGGCYIPVNVAAPINKLVQLAELIQPNVIVTDAAGAREIAKNIPSPLIVDPLDAGKVAPLQGAGRRSSTAYVILTSGSTGSPKGVVVSTSAFAHYMNWVSNSGIFRGDDRVSQFPNISFDLSVLDIFGALNAGATLAPATKAGDRLFPADFARRLAISVWVSVPSAVGLVMKGGQATSAMLGAIRLFVFCGEALRPAHLAAIFQARPDVVVMNLYGPTEATVSMTSVLLRSEDYREACRIPRRSAIRLVTWACIWLAAPIWTRGRSSSPGRSSRRNIGATRSVQRRRFDRCRSAAARCAAISPEIGPNAAASIFSSKAASTPR